MHSTLTLYDLATGEIKYTVEVPATDAPLQGEYGDAALDGDYQGDRYYVDLATHQPVEREPIPYQLSAGSVPADNVTELIISGLPSGTILRLTYEHFEIVDGQAELTFEDPGVYEIALDNPNPRYLPTTLTVEAT